MTDYWRDKDHQPDTDEIAFDYLKSDNFAVHWADGAVGGVTPSGYIHFSVYAERMAIPRRIVYKVREDGELGEENRAKRIARDAIVRELACDVMMAPEVAEDLAKWLLQAVENAKSLASAGPEAGLGDTSQASHPNIGKP